MTTEVPMIDEEGFIDVSLAQDGGVLKKIIKEAPDSASGPPPNGNEVEAHYTGKFLVMSTPTAFCRNLF